MATRSSSNKGQATARESTLRNRQKAAFDGRSTNVQPAAINTQDNTRGIIPGLTAGMTYGEGQKVKKQVEEGGGLPATNQIDQTRAVPMAEEVSVAMNEGGKPVTTRMPMGMGNILNVKRPTERPNEALTTGIVPSLTPQEIGDLDFLVLADLAENSDVDALRQAFSF